MFDSMNEINCPYPLSISTDEEREQISDEVMHFNARAVPFTQKETPIFKNYVLKDNNKIIVGINAIIYHWGILYIDEIYVSDSYRHQHLGTYLMDKVERKPSHLVQPFLIWIHLVFKRKTFI